MAGESARHVAAGSRARAERQLRHAERFERGAEGEEQTALRLAALPEGWTVLHDLSWPGRRFANLDHVVVGPAGVFVVDSKNWSGSVTLAADVLRQNGRSRERTVASCAEAALAVAEVAGPASPHVVPVLCFVQPGPLSGWARDVMVCTTDNITEMLLGRPVVMSADDVARTVELLEPLVRREAEPVVVAPPEPERNRLLSAPPPPAVSEPSSTGRTGVRLGAVGLFAVGMLLFGPQVATMVGDGVTHLFEPGQTCGGSAKSSAKNRSDLRQASAATSRKKSSPAKAEGRGAAKKQAGPAKRRNRC